MRIFVLIIIGENLHDPTANDVEILPAVSAVMKYLFQP
jgi:hypothetical protein